MQSNLFPLTKPPISNKVKFELPDLTHVKRIALDTETDGLNLMGPSVPVGLSVSIEGDFEYISYYIPWGHRNGFNFDFDNVLRWANENLSNKIIEFANAKFDLHGLFKVGIDLEKLGSKPRDILHRVALLNSKRISYKLDDIAKLYLGEQYGKVILVGNAPIHERYSEEIWHYATRDTELTLDLANVLQEQIEAEDLDIVRDLEDSLIYAICAMERKGVLIDREKLERWQAEVKQLKSTIFWELYRTTGMRVEPTNANSVAQLCKSLGIKTDLTDTGKPSIKNEWLKQQLHPALRKVYQFRKLSDLDSDFLTKYLDALDSNNRIRYNLNQLKSDEYGTVTGRLSASGSRRPDEEGYKINVQQVIKTDEGLAADEIISSFPIRELFLPDDGYSWISSDASQLQFRIFAHYSNDARLINEYIQNPDADFHQIVNDKILRGLLGEGKPGRAKAKHVNFGQLFGMGINKLADKLNVSLDEAKEISDIYHSNFPAAKRLSYTAQGFARHPSLGPHPTTGVIGRGYVRTISKRRRRYEPDENLNSAVNAVIQGTEADIVKDKLILIHENREWLNYEPFFSVHDSSDGQAPIECAENTAKKLQELLNDHTSFETRFGVKIKVPITWEVKVGRNWHT